MAIARWDEGVRAEMSEMSRQGITSYKMYMVYDALRVDDGRSSRPCRRPPVSALSLGYIVKTGTCCCK